MTTDVFNEEPQATLERFLASTDFRSGVISATKASWGGSGYCVELFPDGTWRAQWTGQIGNKYDTPGVLLRLPTLSDEATHDLSRRTGTGRADQVELILALGEVFDAEKDELAEELRDTLRDSLAMREEMPS